MSPTRRPSSVPGLRRGVAAAPAAAEARPADNGAVVPARPPRPEKPVRFTLDLDRDRHQFLKTYAVQIEAGASEVLRALVDQLREDPDLATRVRARVWQARQR